MTDERPAGLLDRQIEEFMGWLFRNGGAEPPRREYDAVEQRLRLFLLSEAVAQVPAQEERLDVDLVRVSTEALIVVMSRFCHGRYGEAPTAQEWRDMLGRAARLAAEPHNEGASDG